MVYDYFRTALGSNPLNFAESFYVRYPKVAIGHWPPGYYAVQAVWYGLFGASVWTARTLSAAIAATVAVVLFRRLRPECGGRLAFAAALAFLAIPWVQRTAWEVMSDLLTGLFVFLAILAFSDLLDAKSPRPPSYPMLRERVAGQAGQHPPRIARQRRQALSLPRQPQPISPASIGEMLTDEAPGVERMIVVNPCRGHIGQFVAMSHPSAAQFAVLGRVAQGRRIESPNARNASLGKPRLLDAKKRSGETRDSQ